MDPLTTLLVEAQHGDRLALGDFIRRTQPDIWRLVAYLVGRDAADDVTQEVYTQAWLALPRYRADSTARTWLFVIARRTCIRARRHQQRRQRIDSQPRTAGHEPDPADAVVLGDLLDHLSIGHRTAFVLTQLLGLSYAEAAEVCNCAVGTIRSRLARARAQLIDELGDSVPPSAIEAHGRG